VGAYTQTNAKRFLAFFSAAQWSTLLLVVAKPTALSLSASVYYFLGVSISLSLIYPVLGAFHEFAGDDEMRASYGAGRRGGMAGVLLLSGLSFFLFVPPLMGFPALFHVLAAHFEQQSIVRVLGFACLQLLYAFVAVRLIADVFFRDAEAAFFGSTKAFVSPKMSTIIGAGIVIVALAGGLFWDQIFVTLEAAAKNFVI
jgi:formate hydrogenlyase subunit 3/multisubunit Na+/H+ antiporter MnhD subunit